ncbi:hypothetical protein H4O18_13280 [Arenibacter sp. BSSL-BM3]|uniref:Uncharacterized protein n=1 Tax=Arenibacter arenosicollis TaxID=2762274 RepID=A0ABR7QP59_9FLAO|nr:hypothetical protein [Arenibacter arenosicollis]MBC8768968.1 hypothetical protein [Arenibacter arenosicollis]
MSQDLREMFKRIDSVSKESMKDGHEERFLKRMEEELPMAKRASFPLYKIAASLIILFGLGALIFIKISVPEPIDATVVEKGIAFPEEKGISLGDLSPDLKKVEDYYMVNINLELSQLKISDRNKALIDSFMEQLEALNVEYKKLNTELNEIGPNDQTITALIKNLQLRLLLLHKLRDKLQELKKISNEEGKNDLITSI